jgi:hypothetical protein
LNVEIQKESSGKSGGIPGAWAIYDPPPAACRFFCFCHHAKLLDLVAKVNFKLLPSGAAFF